MSATVRPGHPDADPGTDLGAGPGSGPPEHHDPGIDARTVGATLVGLALLLGAYQVIAGHLIPPLATFAGLFAASGAVVLLRPRRWSLLVAGTVALVYLAGGVEFFVANLAHPESPVSFLAEAFLLIGLVAVLVTVAAALRRAVGHRRPVAVGAGSLAVLAVVVSIVAGLAVDSEAPGDDDVAVVVERSSFPGVVEVPAGTTVLWVDNQDPFHHTLVIDDTDVRAVLPASTGVRVPVDLPAGDHRYWCDVPGHEAMEGTLRVR